MGHPTSPRSRGPSCPPHPIVPWDPHQSLVWVRVRTRARVRARARNVTAGISYGIPRHHGTIGWDGHEGLSIFHT